MSLVSIPINRAIRPKVIEAGRGIGEGIAEAFGTEGEAARAIVKVTTAVVTVGTSLFVSAVTADAIGAVASFLDTADALDAADAATSVAGAGDAAASTADVHFGADHTPDGRPVSTPDIFGNCQDGDHYPFHTVAGSSEVQPGHA